MKKCTICKNKKSLSEFNKNSFRKDGYQIVCRTCSKKRSKKYYNINKEKHKAYVYKKRRELRDLVREIKGKAKCTMCKEPHIATLDFHHKNPKEKEIEISTAVCYFGWSKDKVMKEIEKCIVLCSNCHRKIEWERRYGYEQ